MKRRSTWVLVGVTLIVLTVAAVVGLAQRRSEPPRASDPSSSSLLVMTWAPALCKVVVSASGCRSGRVDKLGNSFVLHGLWPQPSSLQYCNVPEDARKRTALQLPADLQEQLQTMMSDPAVLAPHEWYAHGSCSGVGPADYFTIATTLASQAISVLEPVFEHPGDRVASRSVRDAFDARFGQGSGARVTLVCRDARGEGNVIFEVRVSLPPVSQLRQHPSLGDALAAAPTVAPGCGQARVP